MKTKKQFYNQRLNNKFLQTVAEKQNISEHFNMKISTTEKDSFLSLKISQKGTTFSTLRLYLVIFFNFYFLNKKTLQHF
jgi:hypothetical protein